MWLTTQRVFQISMPLSKPLSHRFWTWSSHFLLSVPYQQTYIILTRVCTLKHCYHHGRKSQEPTWEWKTWRERSRLPAVSPEPSPLETCQVNATPLVSPGGAAEELSRPLRESWEMVNYCLPSVYKFWGFLLGGNRQLKDMLYLLFIRVLTNLLIVHLFSNYLVSTCCVAGIVVGTGGYNDKQDRDPAKEKHPERGTHK